MAYEDYEISPVGQPVEMYLFREGSYCWAYTSADGQQSYNGRTYQAVTISRGDFQRDEEAGSTEIEVRLSDTLKVTSQFLDGSTPTPVRLWIYRRHRSDDDAIVLFRGTVANAMRIGEEVVLTCVSPLSANEKAIPRELILRTCPHVLYGPRCTVDPNGFEDVGTLASISGNVYRVTGLSPTASGWYTAGVLKKASTGQRAFVQGHSYAGGSHYFTLLQPVPGWATSDSITAWAGCDRVVTTCRDKFSNVPNFGGFPFHPERNPFLDLDGN